MSVLSKLLSILGIQAILAIDFGLVAVTDICSGMNCLYHIQVSSGVSTLSCYLYVYFILLLSQVTIVIPKGAPLKWCFPFW